MNIGVPTEIKNNECRVALTPNSVKSLTDNNHNLFVQSGSATPCWSGSSTQQTSLAGQHTHSFTTNAPSGASDGVNKNIPEYFALAFIMKT